MNVPSYGRRFLPTSPSFFFTREYLNSIPFHYMTNITFIPNIQYTHKEKHKYNIFYIIYKYINYLTHKYTPIYNTFFFCLTYPAKQMHPAITKLAAVMPAMNPTVSVTAVSSSSDFTAFSALPTGKSITLIVPIRVALAVEVENTTFAFLNREAKRAVSLRVRV
jgi:hypothetical protein